MQFQCIYLRILLACIGMCTLAMEQPPAKRQRHQDTDLHRIIAHCDYCDIRAYIDQISCLPSGHAELNRTDDRGVTPLDVAMVRYITYGEREIYDIIKHLIDTLAEYQQPPLQMGSLTFMMTYERSLAHYVCKKSSHEALCYALKNAVMNEKHDMCQLLLQYNADLDTPTFRELAQSAFSHQNRKLFKLLSQINEQQPPERHIQLVDVSNMYPTALYTSIQPYMLQYAVNHLYNATNPSVLSLNMDIWKKEYLQDTYAAKTLLKNKTRVNDHHILPHTNKNLSYCTTTIKTPYLEESELIHRLVQYQKRDILESLLALREISPNMYMDQAQRHLPLDITKMDKNSAMMFLAYGGRSHKWHIDADGRIQRNHNTRIYLPKAIFDILENIACLDNACHNNESDRITSLRLNLCNLEHLVTCAKIAVGQGYIRAAYNIMENISASQQARIFIHACILYEPYMCLTEVTDYGSLLHTFITATSQTYDISQVLYSALADMPEEIVIEKVFRGLIQNRLSSGEERILPKPIHQSYEKTYDPRQHTTSFLPYVIGALRSPETCIDQDGNNALHYLAKAPHLSYCLAYDDIRKNGEHVSYAIRRIALDVLYKHPLYNYHGETPDQCAQTSNNPRLARFLRLYRYLQSIFPVELINIISSYYDEISQFKP